jgi:hypothetical protein
MRATSGLNQSGIAVLETSVLVTVLFSFAMAAVGLLSYLGEVSATHRAVDELVVADSVKPLRVTMNQGTVAFSLNSNGLASYLSTVLQRLQDRIGSGTPYRIELQYQVMNVNESTGVFTGFQASAGNFVSAGTFAGTSTSCQELGVMFAAASTQVGANNRSTYAVPTGVSGLSSAATARNYLPMSVLVGVRVLRDLDSTGVGQLYKAITQAPLIAVSCKTLVLRGDVEG